MNRTTLASAVVAGVAAALVALFAASMALQTVVEFYVPLAIPPRNRGRAGTGAVVLDRVGRETPPLRRGLALATAAVGITVPVLYFGALFGLEFAIPVSIGGATVVGLFAGVVVFTLF